ncbi:MAG: YitT family protein [Parabacteroides sp.]|nr:YitT family protein [Parabacteroides sp.]
MRTAKFYKVYFSIQDYLMILFGTLLYGFGFNAFILSNEIVTGGVSGICALIFFTTGGAIPVSVSYFVINVVLLLAALKILGFKFLIKTIFGVFSLSASLSFFEWLLKGTPILHDQPFMAIMLGALLCGAGLGLVFSANESTGGTDIIGAIVNKYKNISIGRALLFCDFFIISSSFFLFHNVDKIVFGFVEMIISNYVLDMALNGNRQSVQFFIFSQKYDEIAERIIHDLDRGCTILDGVGGYSRKPVKVVVLLAKKSESVSIFRLVKQIDHQAFISQSIVRGGYGEGFDQIKT